MPTSHIRSIHLLSKQSAVVSSRTDQIIAIMQISIPICGNFKSNSTAGTVSVKAILPRHPLPASFFLKQVRNEKMFDLENEVQGHGVHHSKQSQPMANINLHRSYT